MNISSLRDANIPIRLDAAGLVALADLATISKRTALTGSASILDILFLAPGIHTQQEASNVNGGELPTTAAMTTGYVFRIENQATVHYLQRIGDPGCLVTVQVVDNNPHSPFRRLLTDLFYTGSIFASILYATGISLTIFSLLILGINHDFWAVAVLLMLVAARFLNTIVIKRRTQVGWKGAPEPGVKGDLLVLLSQDRWVRMRGWVDDLKVTTAGQWLREETQIEGFASAFATLLVFLAAALATNASTVGSIFIAGLLLINVTMLGLCNSLTKDLRMFGRTVHITGEPKKYKRRLEMAEELMKETGRTDWAISMGLVLPPKDTPATKVTI